MSLLKSITFILCLVFALESTAQILPPDPNQTKQVGPWSVGGNVQFSSGNVNQFFFSSFLSPLEKSTFFNFNPVLTYGLNNNRTSINLLLGTIFGKQSGPGIFAMITPIQFSTVRPTEERLTGFSIGASTDHYFFLNNIFGIGLELGVNYQKINSTSVQETFTFQSMIFDRIETANSNNTFSVFLAPTFDLFLSQSININFSIGGLDYFISSFDSSNRNSNQFQANIALDNLGLGMEFNF